MVHHARVATATLLLLALAASPAAAEGGVHPAHIHAGTCAALGDVVVPLGDVSAALLDDGTPTAGERIGPADAVPLLVSTTTVELPIAAIAEGGHSVAIHESAAEMQTIVACGEVGGTLAADGSLSFGLRPVDGSGVSGSVRMEPGAEGDETRVIVSIPDHEERGGSAGDGIAAVALKEFVVALEPETIVVGQEIAFQVMNDGVIEHELVLEPAGEVDAPLTMPAGGAAEIEGIAPGASGELVFTFDTPGTYQLACHIEGHYEAGMVTTFEVVAG